MTQLGFGNPPEPKFVYVGHEGDHYWYFYDHDAKKKVPIHERALSGYLTDCQLVEREYQGEKNWKMRLSITVGNDVFVIQSGAESVFSRIIMQSLLILTDDALAAPITISVQGSDDGRVVFGNVHTANEKIFLGDDYDRDAKGYDLANDLQARLGSTPRPDMNPNPNQVARMPGEGSAGPTQEELMAQAFGDPDAPAPSEPEPAPQRSLGQQAASKIERGRAYLAKVLGPDGFDVSTELWTQVVSEALSVDVPDDIMELSLAHLKEFARLYQATGDSGLQPVIDRLVAPPRTENEFPPEPDEPF